MYKIHYVYRQGNASLSHTHYIEDEETFLTTLLELEQRRLADHHDRLSLANRLMRAYRRGITKRTTQTEHEQTVSHVHAYAYQYTPETEEEPGMGRWVQLQFTVHPPTLEIH